MDQDIFMKEETYVQGGGFAALVRRYSKPLLAMAYRYTFDWESAKDVCQDTWLRVYEKISVYDGRVPFERWLFAVHRNICISFLRKRKRRGETRLELDIYRSSEPARERILQAASRLPERQRMVFAMIDLEQMTIDEAAALIGIKPVSIRTNLFHARKRIAGILQGSEERT
jgi:RNA polymerase sigma-70 factor (ECF subfamily)